MGGASSGTALFRNNSSPRLLQFKAALPASKQILMAGRKAKKVNLSEDLRCFENPYLSDAACNHPGAAVGKVHWP